MKKILSLVLVLALCLSVLVLAGCGKKDADDVDGVSGATFTSNAVKEAAAAALDSAK